MGGPSESVGHSEAGRVSSRGAVSISCVVVLLDATRGCLALTEVLDLGFRVIGFRVL